MSNRLADEKGGEYRSPPKNLEAEQALLGAILVNNEAVHLVANFLEPEHFFSCLSMKVRSPMPCSCSCLSPTRSQRRRRELHGADSDMAQRLETAIAHTLRLGSLAELHG